MTYLQQLINTFLTLWLCTAYVKAEMSEESISLVKHGAVRQVSEKMNVVQKGAKSQITHSGL